MCVCANASEILLRFPADFLIDNVPWCSRSASGKLCGRRVVRSRSKGEYLGTVTALAGAKAMNAALKVFVEQDLRFGILESDRVRQDPSPSPSMSRSIQAPVHHPGAFAFENLGRYKMRWISNDAEKHTHKANASALKDLWAKVANESLEKTGDEGRAIREANAVVARQSDKH